MAEPIEAGVPVEANGPPPPADGPRSARRPCGPASASAPPVLETRGLGVRAGNRTLLRGVDLAVRPNEVHAIIGPSGAGKSTLLRCLNRLVDLTPALRVEGEVLFHGRSIRGDRGGPVGGEPALHDDELRTRVGMLFQQAVVFPGSILANVVFGVRRLGRVPRRALPAVAERALREAALWDEVADRLGDSAATLSVGQQQRLCLARVLASRPEVILMDEPTSALDPRSTEAIEALCVELEREHTIVLVTHDLAQARRVADRVSCLCVVDGAGELLESACCDELLDDPQCQAVAEYLRHARG